MRRNTLRNILMATAALILLVPAVVITCLSYSAYLAVPSLARHGHMDFGMPSAEWSSRLRARFLGGSERDAIVELTLQGFLIEEQRQRANYRWSTFPCEYGLTAHWTSDAGGKVTSIDGDFVNACL